FRRWADALFLPDTELRAQEIVRYMGEWEPEETANQRFLLRHFQLWLSYENPQERQRIVREMLEIFTTEVFRAVAVSDLLWGLAYIHGPISAFRIHPGGRQEEDLLLSVTGGMGHRAVLQLLLQRWAAEGAFLGVGHPLPSPRNEKPLDRERLDIT